LSDEWVLDSLIDEWGRWVLLRKAEAYDVGVLATLNLRFYFGGMTSDN